jgi:ligand-binding sensor domain-containing protein
LAVEGNDTIWIGTTKGLVKFNGSEWIVYNPTDSGLYGFNFINAIALDNNGSKWIGTDNGLAEFNRSQWENHTPANSLISINSISIDEEGNKWLGTNNWGLAKYNSEGWTFFNSYNSEFPEYCEINSIAIAKNGTVWIGTEGSGLIKFYNSQWERYYTNNSGISDNYIYSLAIDESGNKWMGTGYSGVAVYKEGGVVTAIEENKKDILTTEFSLEQNYPNPFNPATTIRYAIPEAGLLNITIFNVLGQKVKTLFNSEQSAGSHQIEFNASNLPSGIYFYRLSSGDFSETKKMILLK